MSTMRSSSRRAFRRPSQPPEFYAQLLGSSIRAARLLDGRPLEELAPQAGMTVQEWEQMETGEVLPCWELLLWVTGMLSMGRSWVPYLARLYAGTQQIRI